MNRLSKMRFTKIKSPKKYNINIKTLDDIKKKC